MLGHRLERWLNIDPALEKRNVFAGYLPHMMTLENYIYLC